VKNGRRRRGGGEVVSRGENPTAGGAKVTKPPTGKCNLPPGRRRSTHCSKWYERAKNAWESCATGKVEGTQNKRTIEAHGNLLGRGEALEVGEEEKGVDRSLVKSEWTKGGGASISSYLR